MMLPTGIKNQGSIGGGIAMIVIGAVISTVGIFVAWYVISTQSMSILMIPVSFFYLISITSIICGVVTLVKGIKGRKIMEQGTKRPATIVDKYYTHSHQNHANVHHYIVISYKSDTNQERQLRVQLNNRNAYRLERGMTIECYVLGEDCYVDLKNEVRILKEPEGNEGFKNPFFQS